MIHLCKTQAFLLPFSKFWYHTHLFRTDTLFTSNTIAKSIAGDKLVVQFDIVFNQLTKWPTFLTLPRSNLEGSFKLGLMFLFTTDFLLLGDLAKHKEHKSKKIAQLSTWKHHLKTPLQLLSCLTSRKSEKIAQISTSKHPLPLLSCLTSPFLIF